MVAVDPFHSRWVGPVFAGLQVAAVALVSNSREKRLYCSRFSACNLMPSHNAFEYRSCHHPLAYILELQPTLSETELAGRHVLQLGEWPRHLAQHQHSTFRDAWHSVNRALVPV